jgi:hypothetical protein
MGRTSVDADAAYCDAACAAAFAAGAMLSVLIAVDAALMAPLAFGRKLQCKPVRGEWTPERNVIGRTHSKELQASRLGNSMASSSVNFLSKNAHRTTATTR